MLEPVFDFLEKLISDFSLKRLFTTLFMLLLLFLMVYLYESVTGYFEYQKVLRSLDLVEKTLEISEKLNQSDNPAMRTLYEHTLGRINAFIAPDEEKLLSSTNTMKVLFASLPWFLLILALIFKNNVQYEKVSVVGGVIFVAIPFVVIGYFLPTFEQSWINYFIYPWFSFFLVLVVIILRSKKHA
ncbi:hypothetical protein [Vibrio cincinnatiensis]|uniref:hypothetical protein n=1 Tax=Vibrio cincinnatiensis TaxID=675 RepID=UPI001EDCF613|nr:hypothetical protein [Vibrio cincinnatiensis]MCG3727392.1 hypothetical protein [Vibrio cincinnatiensis]